MIHRVTAADIGVVPGEPQLFERTDAVPLLRHVPCWTPTHASKVYSRFINGIRGTRISAMSRCLAMNALRAAALLSADHGYGFPIRDGLQAVNMCGESGAF